MADLVSLPEVKLALRIDGDDYDFELARMIRSASETVYEFIKADPSEYETSGGTLDEELVPSRVKSAAISLVAYYNRWVDEPPVLELKYGEMPWQVQNMLMGLRDPTLA